MSILSKLNGLKGGKPKYEASELEGVITFFGAHHALKGEKVLSQAGVRVLLIPGPREISPNCGTALRFDFTAKERIPAILGDSDILFEEIHHYPA